MGAHVFSFLFQRPLEESSCDGWKGAIIPFPYCQAPDVYIYIFSFSGFKLKKTKLVTAEKKRKEETSTDHCYRSP